MATVVIFRYCIRSNDVLVASSSIFKLVEGSEDKFDIFYEYNTTITVTVVVK